MDKEYTYSPQIYESFYEFEELPEDIRYEILHRSGAYSVTRKYYEDMRYHRELKCTLPISNREIMKVYNNSNTNVRILLVSHIDHRTTITFFDSHDMGMLMKEINIMGKSISTRFVMKSKRLKLHPNLIELVDYDKREDDIVSYSDILLTPITMREILLGSRDLMCSKYIDIVISDYIRDTYHSLSNIQPFICTIFLVSCSEDLDIDLNKLVGLNRDTTHRVYLLSDITDDNVSSVNSIIYDTIIDVLDQ